MTTERLPPLPTMILPVRCFTCNKVIGNYSQAWDRHKDNPRLFFLKYKIRRYCCQKIFMTHIDIFEFDAEVNLPHVDIRCGSDVKKILRAV